MMMMKAAEMSEMLVYFRQNAWHNIPGYSTLHTQQLF